MESFKEILDNVYFENSILDYLIALGGIIIGILFVRILKKSIIQRAKVWVGKTDTEIDDFVIHSFEHYGIPALYVAVIYAGSRYLAFSAKVNQGLRMAFTLLVTFLVLRIISSIILLFLQKHVIKKDGGEQKVKQLGGLMLIINLGIWGIGLLFLFDNLGFDVTAAVAGLGIGGVAIALASQNILGDLFNYFVILFDKPFETGDFIIIDDKMGVVDYIGVKSTRVKSLSGEQLVFANSDMTGSRIHNYKRMERRRIVFSLGIIYETPPDLLRAVPGILKSVIQKHQLTEFDRAHFASYGAYSLDFEVVYYVLSSDYAQYMDIQQSINFEIFEEFKRRGIEFAYPTQSLLLTRQPQPAFQGVN